MRRYRGILVVLAIIVVVIGGLGYRLYQGLYGPWGIFGRVDASRALLAKPENYKPAAIAMAKLLNTDVSLLTPDMRELPPNWTPPEIGKLGPLELIIEHDFVAMSTTSGLAEFNGYKVERTKSSEGEKEETFVLSVDFGLPQLAATYEFTLPKGQGYTEEELVQGALAELDRRAAARAARTDPAISYQMSDPVADRKRLLQQHSGIAKQWGLSVPEAATTRANAIP